MAGALCTKQTLRRDSRLGPPIYAPLEMNGKIRTKTTDVVSAQQASESRPNDDSHWGWLP